MLANELTTVAQEMEQTVAAIFETMMGLVVKPDSQAWWEESNRVAASVHFTGSCSGVIMLEVSRPQACFFAGRFLSMDTPEAIDNDVRDVLGELANMIGGNLKSATVPDATLSIPEVVDGSDFSLRFCGVNVVARQAFNCDEGMFWVSLFELRTHSDSSAAQRYS
jgi:CheY-specific phosphatase CheX